MQSIQFASDTELLADHAKAVFRPVQYLGSKLRTLGPIVDLISSTEPKPRRVCDLFSGTTVVSQALAHADFSVIAVDVMRFSSVFARALLGIGRQPANKPEEALKWLLPPCRLSPSQAVLEPWLSWENEALARKDADALLDIARTVPQIWRAKGALPSQLNYFRLLSKNIGGSGFELPVVISAFYAGTYFGLAQAAEIDRLRASIESLYSSRAISKWEEDVLLTALLSVVSDCVFSPGKHFAQPHRISDKKDLTFLRRRIVKDRSLNFWQIFCERVTTIARVAQTSGVQHKAYHATFEYFMKGDASSLDVDLIYADPPYTAQQYSRFYHVPETIMSYKIPRLQYHQGRVTHGIYPDDRYKSRFCSKRQASQAFLELINWAGELSVPLLISYSGTSSGITGNDRMITLDELVALCGKRFKQDRIDIFNMDFTYRQFNSRGMAIPGRLDKEYLIYLGVK